MSNSLIDISDLESLLLKQEPWIDVRAPIEYADGHLPNSVNLPLLNDAERAQVGTTYKQKGREAAIETGQSLIQGSLRDERIAAWKKFAALNPHAKIYCFRGGLRSQISQTWLSEAGIDVPRLKGGYKEARSWLLEKINSLPGKMPCLVVTGPTGSGKTDFLKSETKSHLDLENLARHRGSAFGFQPGGQPTQAQFENELALELLKLKNQLDSKGFVLVEDESRLIGRNVIPEALFLVMRKAPVLWLEVPLEARVENIYRDYILKTAIGQGPVSDGLALFDRYLQSLKSISKKLGGLRYEEIRKGLLACRSEFEGSGKLDENRQWIEQLLIHYYDPLYLGNLERRKPLVAFQGSVEKARSWLQGKPALPVQVLDKLSS